MGDVVNIDEGKLEARIEVNRDLARVFKNPELDADGSHLLGQFAGMREDDLVLYQAFTEGRPRYLLFVPWREAAAMPPPAAPATAQSATSP